MMRINIIRNTSLSKFSKMLIIIFWIVFLAYMVCKFYFKEVPDFYLDFLVLISLMVYVAIYTVKSIGAYKRDRDFYKKFSWLIIVYVSGSLIAYFLYLEIFEDMPGLVKNNMLLSTGLFLVYIIFLKIKNSLRR